MRSKTSAAFAALVALAVTPALAAPMAPEDLFAKLSPTIWVVRAQHGASPIFELGSAVVISPRLLVTACHVVASATGVTIARDNGKRVVKINTVTRDPDHKRDLCLLSADENLPAVPAVVAPIEAVKVGEKAYAIGSPLGLELTLTDGLVSALRVAPGETMPGIQTSAAIAPGSSGGGLFDDEGHLIGVTIAIASKETDNLAFAYPAEWVMQLPQRIHDAQQRWTAVLVANGISLSPDGLPIASGYAAIDDVASVPTGGNPAGGVGDAYKQFLLLSSPRAFVVTSDGRWGAVGDADALNSLLKDCADRHVECRLYAVDDTVVWRPDKAFPVPTATVGPVASH
ncbi:MAG TPA: trypsin-like peptidase domain-containing protein [Caulobacteraceae bacterium]|jgi:S1-C subfamily serine protease|nr:trypsin-like peptidase domain-containing protein [Caulobacteraceae bacterium]